MLLFNAPVILLKIQIFLACSSLASVGRGQTLPKSPSVDRQRSLVLVEQPLAEVNQSRSRERFNAKGNMLNPVNALAIFLLAFETAAAFSPSASATSNRIWTSSRQALPGGKDCVCKRSPVVCMSDEWTEATDMDWSFADNDDDDAELVARFQQYADSRDYYEDTESSTYTEESQQPVGYDRGEMGVAVSGGIAQLCIAAEAKKKLANEYYSVGVKRCAEELQREIVLHRILVYGNDHPYTLRSKDCLAKYLRIDSDLKVAAELTRDVFEVNKDRLGFNHIVTLKSAERLVNLLLKNGDLQGAEDLLREALEAHVLRRGENYTSTIICKTRLADVLQKRWKLEEAEKLQREVLDVYLQRQPWDPQTASIMERLAQTLQLSGDLRWAEEFQWKALDARINTLGYSHPRTLGCMSRCARILKSLGYLEQAEQLQVGILKTSMCKHGPEHPYTLISRIRLADIWQARGYLEGAEMMQRDGLMFMKRVLHPENKNMLWAKEQLAYTLRCRGDRQAVQELWQEDMEVVDYNSELYHPLTDHRKSNLAKTFYGQRDFKVAENLFREIYDSRHLALGAEHPDTLGSKEFLARAMLRQGGEDREEDSQDAGKRQAAREKMESIEALHREAHEARIRIFGHDHPEAIKSKSIFSETLIALGDLQGAKKLRQEAFESSLQTFGPEHPRARLNQKKLAGLLIACGDVDGAKELSLELEQTSARKPATRQNSLLAMGI